VQKFHFFVIQVSQYTKQKIKTWSFSPICKLMNCQFMRVQSVCHLHEYILWDGDATGILLRLIEWSIIAYSVRHFAYQQQQQYYTK